MRRLPAGAATLARATAVATLVCASATAPAAGARSTGTAAPGCGGTAVSVVVDPGPLGGEVTQRCADDGGGLTAAQLTDLAGFDLELVPGAGFVCRVDGRPGPDTESCSRTPPADAYWGLFWAPDGDSPWTYATLGATALTVPTGGVLGWRWQDGGQQEEPPAVSGEPVAGEAAQPQDGDGASSDEASSDEASSNKASSDAEDGTGAPLWAAGLVVAALAGAVVVLVRRRRG